MDVQESYIASRCEGHLVWIRVASSTYHDDGDGTETALMYVATSMEQLSPINVLQPSQPRGAARVQEIMYLLHLYSLRQQQSKKL